MNLDHEQLDHLLATIAESDIQEFCLEGKDFRLEIKRIITSLSPIGAFSLSISVLKPNSYSLLVISLKEVIL